jgi:hypothetical protein
MSAYGLMHPSDSDIVDKEMADIEANPDKYSPKVKEMARLRGLRNPDEFKRSRFWENDDLAHLRYFPPFRDYPELKRLSPSEFQKKLAGVREEKDKLKSRRKW